MTRTYTNCFRIIRAGLPTVATELKLDNDRGLQMPGTGPDVEAALLAARKEMGR